MAFSTLPPSENRRMTPRQFIGIAVGVVGAIYISLYALEYDVVKHASNDPDLRDSFLTTPLVVAGMWGFLLYPTVYSHLRPIRHLLRLFEQLATVGYVLLGLLAVLAPLGCLTYATSRRRVDELAVVMLALSAIAVWIGAFSLRSRFKLVDE